MPTQVKSNLLSSPAPSVTSPAAVPKAKLYLVEIPPKANFNVDRRELIVNDGEPIGLPLNQPNVMVELVKPDGENNISIYDYCLTSLSRNISFSV